MHANSEQLSDFEDLKKFDQLEVVYKEKAENLTAEFAKYLADMYPNHEKDIYNKIKPEKVDIYFAKYPELQSSRTLVALVGQIRELQNDRYQQAINRTKTLKEIRYRQINPWIFNSWVPKYVETK